MSTLYSKFEYTLTEFQLFPPYVTLPTPRYLLLLLTYVITRTGPVFRRTIDRFQHINHQPETCVNRWGRLGAPPLRLIIDDSKLKCRAESEVVRRVEIGVV